MYLLYPVYPTDIVVTIEVSIKNLEGSIKMCRVCPLPAPCNVTECKYVKVSVCTCYTSRDSYPLICPMLQYIGWGTHRHSFGC